MGTSSPRFVAWDNLFDELHKHMVCGCPDCGRSTLDYGRVNGGRWYFAIVFPNGQRSDEYNAVTLHDAVRSWLNGEADTLHDLLAVTA